MRAEAQSRWKDGRGCRNPGLTPHPLSSHLRARPLLPIHPQTQPSVLGPFLPCGLCPGHRALSCLTFPRGSPSSPALLGGVCLPGVRLLDFSPWGLGP